MYVRETGSTAVLLAKERVYDNLHSIRTYDPLDQ